MALRAGFHGTVGQPSAQVIDGSLKFNGSSTYLKRTPGSAGNRKTFTWSGWVKRSKLSTWQMLLSAGSSASDRTFIGFVGSDTATYENQIGLVHLASGIVTGAVYLNPKLRDTSEFYHIVISADLTNSTANDRVKGYINGVEVDVTVDNAFENTDTQFNNTVVHETKKAANSSEYIDGQVTQVYFIDGQALQPTEFGFTDGLTGTWRPKKYTGNFGSKAVFNAPLNATPFTDSIGSTITNNGNVSTASANTNTFGITTAADFGGDGRLTTTLTPPSTFTCDVYFDHNDSTGDSYVLGQGTGAFIQVNPASVTTSIYLYGTTEIDLGSYGFKHLRIQFDGSTTTLWSNGTQLYSNTLSPSSGVIYVGAHASLGTRYFTGQIGPVRFTPNLLGAPPSGGLDVNSDGTLNDFIDAGSNSFYLPMDGNSPIGQDKSGKGNNWTPVNFGGSNTIEKATGALPILNTVSGGNYATAGVRTDAYSDSLVLALPLVGIKSDFSNKVNGGTTEKVITANNSSFISTESTYYGGSAAFNGVGSGNLAGASYFTAPASSDWDFGTGDVTIEAWVNWDGTSEFGSRLLYANAGSGSSEQWGILNTGQLGFMNVFSTTSLGTVPVNVWCHVASVRVSGVVRHYINGLYVGGGDNTNSVGQSDNPAYVGTRQDGYHTFSGFMQDFRLYKGAAKYTSNYFTVGTPEPSVLPDTPSGVSGSSKLTKIADGAVAFDGVGGTSDNSYLTVGSSADFAFGTGDFTIEYFLYMNAAPTAAFVPFDFRPFNTQGAYPQMNIGTDLVLSYYTNATFRITTTISTRKWLHIAVSRSGTDTKMFIDGVQAGSTYSDSNNYQQSSFTISNNQFSSTDYSVNGFVSNFRINKGTALYTSNFTPPTEPLTNVTNTKLLCCQSPTSATAAAVSPVTITANGNATATNFNPFTTDINAVRGQETGYATLNPLSSKGDYTFADGNLKVVDGSGGEHVRTPFGVTSGKWYWEAKFVSQTTANDSSYLSVISDTGVHFGIRNRTADIQYYSSGGGNLGTYSSSNWNANDTYSLALDLTTNQLKIYTNNILGATVSVTANLEYFASYFRDGSDASFIFNFGQKPFKYAPPEGFQPLNAANVRPETVIARPDQYVGISTWTGDGTNNRVIQAPIDADFAWIKFRNQSYSHSLYDTVRGNNKRLVSNSTGTEGTVSFSFLNDKNIQISGASDTSQNDDTEPLVGWFWRAGGNKGTFNIDDAAYASAAAAGLDGGTATVTGASVGTKQGFSIIKFHTAGTNSGATIPHGLSKAPNFIVAKALGVSLGWKIYHSTLGNDYFLEFDSDEQYNVANYWGVTSSVFEADASGDLDLASPGCIAYCWTDVPGLQKFGSYAGSDGTTFVELGFRPALLVIKFYDGTDVGSHAGWKVIDNQRNKFNPSGIAQKLEWNTNNSENGGGTISTTEGKVDFLSNGFRILDNHAPFNSSGRSYIYAAWAEAPTFNLYGAQSNAR